MISLSDNPPRDLLLQSLKRFREIGPEIAALTKESKSLRSKIAECAEGLGFGAVSVDCEPVEFLLGNTKVTVSDVTESSDYTVLIKELEQV